MKQNKARLLRAAAMLTQESRTKEWPVPKGPRKVRVFERWLLDEILQAFGKPPVRVVLWDGQEIASTEAAPVARLFIRDRGALYRLIRNPELQFGELYRTDRVEVEGNLVEFLEAISRGMSRVADKTIKVKMLRRLNRPPRNSVARARHNIYKHYDIGNEFYQLWLDSQMVYTCAYFPTPAATLEASQIAKMDHVCRKLRLKPGEKVVEAGCGWGALALHMARHYGVSVKAFNISKEQLAYAREQARREGLDDRVEYIEADYREIAGEFDAFVSVGMLEHVGLDHYAELGEVMHRCLKQTGRGLIHSIGRDRPFPMNAWIEKRIFSGAYPPTLREMMRLFEPWEFSVVDVENLRLHYAKTLAHWLHRYESAVDQVAEMFDASFVRAWRLYLAGSMAAFTTGRLQLFQVSFTRSADNQIPWTRQYLYNE